MSAAPNAKLVRLSAPLVAAIDEWRRQQTEIPSRSKATAILIERAVAALERERATTGAQQP